ncbi:MAG: response regulator [Alphaproteobacteria bacterium TMED150]|nr:MAG: response regulator [Alphaproteobacteria bacterium TMED150]
MNNTLIVIITLASYLAMLMLIARWFENRQGPSRPWSQNLVYMLGLAVYCTSWTLLGSIGLAASAGWAFLPIYVGPILVFLLAKPFLRRYLELASDNNVTSLADFLASRFGRSRTISLLVTLAVTFVSVPYLALQVKAIDDTTALMAGSADLGQWISLPVLFVMALFATSFIGRDGAVSARSKGLLITVAVESGLKLLAALIVGVGIVYFMNDGAVWQAPQWEGMTRATPPLVDLAIIAILAAAAALCLPRQFHMMVLEHPGGKSLPIARWMFPMYLLLINLFVLPVAIIGNQQFGGSISPDMYLLAIPASQGYEFLALLALLGGFSAATAMVLVTSFALSTMITNEILIPAVLRFGKVSNISKFDARKVVLFRRLAVVMILIAAYGAYQGLAQDRALAQIGLVSFAGIAHFAPALVLGVIWRDASSNGVILGLLAGLGSWVLLVMLPELGFVDTSGGIIATLREEVFLITPGYGTLAQASLFSLTLNVLVTIGASFLMAASHEEHLQATRFLNPLRESQRNLERLVDDGRVLVRVGDLRQLLEPYLGEEHTAREFAELAKRGGYNIDDDGQVPIKLIRDCEFLLSGILGRASARLVMAMSLERRRLDVDNILALLDDASEAIQYSRAVLEAAIENLVQGVGVFDEELKLICRNERFHDLLLLPPHLTKMGTNLEDILRHIARRGEFGPGDVDDIVNQRLDAYRRMEDDVYIRERPDGTVLEILTRPIPGLGVVASYHDITEKVRAERTLKLTNAILEKKVLERTQELQATNAALRAAQREAERANRSKTRFFAAASHDLLQPLNAARLFVSSLADRERGDEDKELMQRAEASLAAVDDLLNTLLDITRLDAGVMPINLREVALDEVLEPLAAEFRALAERKKLKLTYVPTSLMVRTDPKLLRRVVANFLANAVRYTEDGRILLGCRRQQGRVVLQVGDTGIGIAPNRVSEVFMEFKRLESAEKLAHGQGLGLAIVQRIANSLNHELKLASIPGRGTMMSILLPMVEKTIAPAPAMDLGRMSGPGRSLKNLPLIFIDDEPDIRKALSGLLERWGVKVQVCATPQEVLSLFRNGKGTPLLVADFFLSDPMDGLQLIAACRAEMPALKALLITAHRDDDVMQRAQDLHVTVIHKPVRPAALRAALSHVA